MSDTMNTATRVLITGAAGTVAQGLVPKLARHYRLRLLDLTRSEEFARHDWATGSILDRSFLKTALVGNHGVVHCAAASKAAARDFTTEEYFDINVKGLYVLLEMCREAGVSRFVHVGSTAPVIGHWYAGERITVDSSWTTRGRYSLTKMLQEQVCEHVARNSDMHIVVLRPWGPCKGLTIRDESGREVPRPYAPGLIEAEDFAEACRSALEAHFDRFRVFHTVATREARERFDADVTERDLGFRAREDFHEVL